MDAARPDSPKSFQDRLGSPDSVKVEFDRAASPRPQPRRRPFSARGKLRTRLPEQWEEILDLVPPPRPPPVTGGVRTFDHLPEQASTAAKELVQRADWTIRRLKVDKKTLQLKYNNLLVPAGQYISSARFQLGRETASLRFWPNGLYGNATKTARMRMDLGGLHTDSWCAVGLAMPEGTRLRFRFHVGALWSDIRICHWHAAGTMVQQIWTPPQQELGDLTNLIVGVEVLEDLTSDSLPGLTPMPWLRSPRFRRLPTVDNNPVQDLTDRQKTLQKAHGILALKALRTQRGLALPSPRFGTGLELLRSSPRCRMAPANHERGN
ncbi:unnamed protein product [Symbiodinium pilosum]|uniref:Uncharacterized protein n=1 Tax=Symbiodinium pilosum TaxID=2952 RepID=A0A812J1C9_SYMPI|nr:unnamed protein product [Symbiodinium pilosum]